MHYVEFVLVIAAIGILIGFVAGAWLGAGLAQLYARFFSFPFLVFTRDPQIYAVAAVITLGVRRGRGAHGRPHRGCPAAGGCDVPPCAGRPTGQEPGVSGRLVALRQTGVMIARHLFRWPLRTLSGILGVAMAVAILVASLWSFGSIQHMIDVTFFRAERT